MRIAISLAFLLVAQVASSQQPPADDSLGPHVKNTLLKGRQLVERLKRASDLDERRRIQREQLKAIRDFSNSVKVVFNTSITSVSPASDGIVTLKTEVHSELFPYTDNSSAYLRGGIFAHPMQINIPADQAADFTVGAPLKISGATTALFGNDVPVRKKASATLLLFDLCLPPIDTETPPRIEVSLSGLELESNGKTLTLKADKDVQEPQPVPTNPALETALASIQQDIEKLIVEAKRQKNTALVTEAITNSKAQIEASIEGQEWEFDAMVIDVIETEGRYRLTATPPPCLQRFLRASAPSKGGILANRLELLVTRDLAESIGRGDVIRIKGKVAIGGFEHFNMESYKSLPLFSMHMPPLDNRYPLSFAVAIENVDLTKSLQKKK